MQLPKENSAPSEITILIVTDARKNLLLIAICFDVYALVEDASEFIAISGSVVSVVVLATCRALVGLRPKELALVPTS